MINYSSEYLKYWHNYDKHRNYLGTRMVVDRKDLDFSSSCSRMRKLGPAHIPHLTLSFTKVMTELTVNSP